MSRRALNAAGITDPELRASYLRCKDLHASHGRTYYLATLLLPPARRPHVWALYGFARYADEIVDDLAVPASPEQRAARFEGWAAARLAEFTGDSTGSTGSTDHADRTGDGIGRAAVHTVRTWGISLEHVAAFLDSMRADLTVTGYETFEDLLGYMHGSAAVIGLQMLPLLRPADPAAAAAPASALGIAFQLTNFIRDVGEDLGRGRLYLPAEDLAAHGVTRADLERGELSPAVKNLMAFQIERARDWYSRAESGVAMLHPDSQECIGAATRLYRGILDEVEQGGYRVLDRRAQVPLGTRLRVGACAYLRARRSWGASPVDARPNRTHTPSVQSTSAKPNNRSSTGA